MEGGDWQCDCANTSAVDEISGQEKANSLPLQVSCFLCSPSGNSRNTFLDVTNISSCYEAKPSRIWAQAITLSVLNAQTRAWRRPSAQRWTTEAAPAIPKPKRQVVIGYETQDGRRYFSEVHGRSPPPLLTREGEDSGRVAILALSCQESARLVTSKPCSRFSKYTII